MKIPCHQKNDLKHNCDPPEKSLSTSSSSLILKFFSRLEYKMCDSHLMSHPHLHLIFSIFFLCVTQFNGVSSVKLTNLDVPEIVYRGESLWLNCSYDLENEPLYSVKWFKKSLLAADATETESEAINSNRAGGGGGGDEGEEVWSEFYRFIPNDDDPQRAFPLTGVNVDISRSIQGNVYLVKADLETEGSFKCEVSADAPSFETVRDVRHLKVYYFSPNQPVIRGLKSHYRLGEYVNSSCSINFPNPQFKSITRLNWFINGDPAPPEYVSSIRGRRILSSLQSVGSGPSPAVLSSKYQADEETSSAELSNATPINNVMASMIRFLVNPKHLSGSDDGIMRLRCTASTTPEAYSRSAEATAHAEPTRGASSNPGRYSSAADSNNSKMIIRTLVSVSIVISSIHFVSLKSVH